jgi:predicted Zn-dependent protease
MSLTKSCALRFASALSEECRRTIRDLRAPGYPRPYYLSYLLRDVHTTEMWGRLGNINLLEDHDSRSLYCDCRVGSYQYDQVVEGGLDDNDGEAESYEHLEMPIGNDTDALKYHVWKLTDVRYREAVRQFLRKKSQHITYLDPNRNLGSFTRARPIVDLQLRPYGAVDIPRWRAFVNASSLVVKAHPQVKNSWVELRVRDVTRVFVNSEGSRLIDQKRICELGCDLWLLTRSGEGIRTHIRNVTPEIAELPSLRSFQREIESRIELLGRLATAPTLKSYAGPVLLAPGPAGILFHEVLGHRLEGSRLLSTREGQTYKRDLGKQILPPSFSIVDDPTRASSAGCATVGSYRYDDEGSPAQAARLVEQGELCGFLSGRAPVARHNLPNGHARNELHERPTSRMANLVVSVSDGVSHAELRRIFLEEIRRQKLRFGIMVLDAEGGETATEAYNFQAFMGSISLAVQVWADGRENLIRNVNFVGTPLSALRTVLAAGDTPRCENAFCGAESGSVPVSTTCPAILMSNLELQASGERKFTQYLLPMPFEKAALSKRSRGKRPPARRAGRR